MNLFILHPNPKVCARYYFDKHVIKIILEAIQMLYTTKLILDPCGDYSLAPKTYRPTHVNHPVTIWVRTSLGNWNWTCELVDALIDEWHYRYEHNKAHACYGVFLWLRSNPPAFTMKDITRPALAMPETYKIQGQPIQSYRDYYQGPEKRKLASWKRRSIPHWYKVS